MLIKQIITHITTSRITKRKQSRFTVEIGYFLDLQQQ